MKNFKKWVVQHNPKLKWDFNDPEKLKKQLIEVIGTSGTLDLKTIFDLFFVNDDPGLTINQQDKFLEMKSYPRIKNK